MGSPSSTDAVVMVMVAVVVVVVAVAAAVGGVSVLSGGPVLEGSIINAMMRNQLTT